MRRRPFYPALFLCLACLLSPMLLRAAPAEEPVREVNLPFTLDTPGHVVVKALVNGTLGTFGFKSCESGALLSAPFAREALLPVKTPLDAAGKPERDSAGAPPHLVDLPSLSAPGLRHISSVPP